MPRVPQTPEEWEAFIENELKGDDTLVYYLDDEKVDEEEKVKPAATSLVKLIVSIWAVLALHEAKIVKLADRSYKILSNWRAFVRLFQKYGRLDIFNLVEEYDDLAGLDRKPEDLKDTPGACAYTDFLELPSVLPPGAIPLPSAAKRGVYNGIATQGPRRASAHEQGPNYWPFRLFYRAFAVKLRHRAVTVLSTPDEEAFRRDYEAEYGVDDTEGLTSREVAMGFISAFEPVQSVALRTYRGNERYNQFLDHFTGRRASKDVLGLNSTDCCTNIVSQLMGIRLGGAGSPTPTTTRGRDQVRVQKPATRELALKAFFAALTTSGYSLNLLHKGGAGTQAPAQTWFQLPALLLGHLAAIHLTDEAARTIGVATQKQATPAVIRLEERAADAGPIDFKGSIDDARFFAKYNIVVEANGVKHNLTIGRGDRFRSCDGHISAIVQLFQQHVGRATLAELATARGVAEADLLVDSSKASELTEERRLQAEEALQGCLSHGLSVVQVDGKIVKGLWKFLIFGGEGNSKTTARVKALEGKSPEDYYVTVRVSPRGGGISLALKRRDDPSPVKPSDFEDFAGERIAVWRDLVNDTRQVVGLEELDQWLNSGYAANWPEDVQIEHLLSGEYPAMGSCRLFKMKEAFRQPMTLTRKPTKEQPMHLLVDVKKRELWWIDPVTKHRKKHSPKSKTGKENLEKVIDIVKAYSEKKRKGEAAGGPKRKDSGGEGGGSSAGASSKKSRA